MIRFYFHNPDLYVLVKCLEWLSVLVINSFSLELKLWFYASSSVIKISQLCLCILFHFRCFFFFFNTENFIVLKECDNSDQHPN